MVDIEEIYENKKWEKQEEKKNNNEEMEIDEEYKIKLSII